jgi:hypothetical protein
MSSPRRGEFFRLHVIQTDSGTLPAFYPMDTGGLSMLYQVQPLLSFTRYERVFDFGGIKRIAKIQFYFDKRPERLRQLQNPPQR